MVFFHSCNYNRKLTSKSESRKCNFVAEINVVGKPNFGQSKIHYEYWPGNSDNVHASATKFEINFLCQITLIVQTDEIKFNAMTTIKRQRKRRRTIVWRNQLKLPIRARIRRLSDNEFQMNILVSKARKKTVWIIVVHNSFFGLLPLLFSSFFFLCFSVSMFSFAHFYRLHFNCVIFRRWKHRNEAIPRACKRIE